MMKNNQNSDELNNSSFRNLSESNNINRTELGTHKNDIWIEFPDLLKLVFDKNTVNSVVDSQKHYNYSNIVYEPKTLIDLDNNTCYFLLGYELLMYESEFKTIDDNSCVLNWLETNSKLNSFVKDRKQKLPLSIDADKFVVKYQQVEKLVVHLFLFRILNGLLNNKLNQEVWNL